MGIIQNIKFNWDPVGFVINMVRAWRPRKCKTEKDYEKSLYEYLHAKCDSIQITKQYAKGRVRADLLVGDSVIIELKYDLNSTAKYQRLIGQLTEYKEWEGQIILLLTGETDKNLRKKLDTDIRESFTEEGLLATSRIHVFDK